MKNAPKWFTVRGDKAGEYVPEVYLLSLCPIGENGDIVALSEQQLNRPYAAIDRAKPARLADKDEKLIARASIDFRKGVWSDILYCGHSAPILDALCVSRRVFDAFESESVKSYRVFPVEPEAKKSDSGLPRGNTMPEYFALLPDPGLDIELEYIESTPYRVARRQGLNRKLLRVSPRVSTWQGFDFLRTSNAQSCCTDRIVELARTHRWTNFEFKPLDVRRDMPTEGIDYLSDKWPPESWYPPLPSDGKSVEQWVEAYLQQSRLAREEARNPMPMKGAARSLRKARDKAWRECQQTLCALTYDLAAEAVPLFIDVVRHGTDEADRSVAAHMLLMLARHTPIDTHVLADLVLPVFERSLRSGEKGFGQATIGLDSYIEVPADLLSLAHQATGRPPIIMPGSR